LLSAFRYGQWNNADMGIILVYLGQLEEALAWLGRAKENDSYFDQPWYWRSIGQACTSLHRDEEALAMFEHLSVSPYRHAAFAAGCHARLGRSIGRAPALPPAWQ
jgi:tetratricopeptide (TPR) repeat protein